VPYGILLQVTSILILGIVAQWIAWRLRLPSILLLLAVGAGVGPLTGLIRPDKLFGDLLPPLVSLSVAVILYEGGLNLRLRELRKLGIGFVFFRLMTIGVLISWGIGAVALHYVLDFRWPVATLLGAIFVVTGPTVIGPMLRHLRLRGRVGALLKWEGIIVDPLGAALAVLVFTVVRAAVIQRGVVEAAVAFSMTLVVGISFGCLAAGAIVVALRRFWVPDSLHNPVSLMFMLVCFVGADAVQDEAGLLAVTVMGVVLANQKQVSIRHVVEFKETLTVILLSFLFVTLTASLRPEDLRNLGWESLLFVAITIFVARPVSVLPATLRSSLPWPERMFLACLAPRGIVAAAIASVFALDLVAAGYPRATEMVPVAFLLVFLTVVIYGLSAGPLARRLGLVQVNPQGVLFVGAHDWARAMALALQSEGVPVVLLDTDWENTCFAQDAGLPCYFGSALAEKTREEIDFGGLARLLAVTSNNEVNSLACLRYQEDFGRHEVYQLPFPTDEAGRHEVVALEHRGRFLFGEDLTFSRLCEIAGRRPEVNKTKLSSDESGYEAFRAKHGSGVIPLFIIKPDGTLQVYTVDGQTKPQPGDVIASIGSNSNLDAPDPL
jgi:NhaP-type Na+/H+ or K+/H+ antiporter